MSNNGQITGHKTVFIRTRRWDDDEQIERIEEEKRRRMEEAIQSRPRFHCREMGEEEKYLRKVERYRRYRAQSHDWLVKRVADGRVELLKRSRLGGIEKEARALWTKKSMTLSSRYLVNEEMA